METRITRLRTGGGTLKTKNKKQKWEWKRKQTTKWETANVTNAKVHTVALHYTNILNFDLGEPNSDSDSSWNSSSEFEFEFSSNPNPILSPWARALTFDIWAGWQPSNIFYVLRICAKEREGERARAKGPFCTHPGRTQNTHAYMHIQKI